MLHEIMTVNIVTICSDDLHSVITLIFAVYRITIVFFFCILHTISLCNHLILSPSGSPALSLLLSVCVSLAPSHTHTHPMHKDLSIHRQRIIQKGDTIEIHRRESTMKTTTTGIQTISIHETVL